MHDVVNKCIRSDIITDYSYLTGKKEERTKKTVGVDTVSDKKGEQKKQRVPIQRAETTVRVRRWRWTTHRKPGEASLSRPTLKE